MEISNTTKKYLEEIHFKSQMYHNASQLIDGISELKTANAISHKESLRLIAQIFLTLELETVEFNFTT